jgi:hypothetical protein
LITLFLVENAHPNFLSAPPSPQNFSPPQAFSMRYNMFEAEVE